jgi:hypothetical protein
MAHSKLAVSTDVQEATDSTGGSGESDSEDLDTPDERMSDDSEDE